MTADELTNSRRRFPKATFTPIRLGDSPAPGADLLAVAATLRSLQVVAAEHEELRQSNDSVEQRTIGEVAERFSTAASTEAGFEAARALRDVSRDDLARYVERIKQVRERVLGEAVKALQEPVPAADVPEGQDPAPAADLSWVEANSMVRARRYSTGVDDLASGIGGRGASSAPMRIAELAQATGASSPMFPRTSRMTMGPLAAQIDSALAGQRFFKIVDPYLPPGSDVATADPIAALDEIDRRRRAAAVVIDLLMRRTVEPLGVLHLESLEMTPVGIERGELVYSLPLAPHEKVTLSHKEWAVRETEFTELVQDHLDNYSERGVAETDEIAISSQTEDRRTDRSSLGPSNGVTMTGPADGTSVISSARSSQESRQHARAITSVASSRSIRDHKVSFTVATTTGTEDFTSRLIENESADSTMRVDYFRRMRRWRVDLYRVGVRMTYDVVIPDPGRRLRARHELIRRYDAALASTFDPKVSPSDIDPYTWNLYAAGYGVTLPAPTATSGLAYEQWQLSSYITLRDAAFGRYTQVLETIRQKRAELARQIDSAADAAALRQLEREQMMRAVLEWLFPGFADATPVDDLGVTVALADADWRQVMEYGEYIKFVHAAIDWDRLSWALYPYFWGAPGRSGMDKLFLTHPDRTHETFLRAGAARVILPIQPGYESELAELLDAGRLGELPSGHRYEPVIDQVTAAQAAFEKLIDLPPPVKGAEPKPQSSGDLIGTWTEYTPTGALDIEVAKAVIKA